MYGILTILCTFLIARLNGFSFKSKEIDPFNTEVSIDDPLTYDDLKKDKAVKEESNFEEEEESDFDDEWI